MLILRNGFVRGGFMWKRNRWASIYKSNVRTETRGSFASSQATC